MLKKLKLFMVMIGCKPAGRLTEQHDIFFGVGENLASLVDQMKLSWPEAKGRIHIDAWREITFVDDFQITIHNKSNTIINEPNHLFFINLGGYLPNEFDEQHYKVITVAESLSKAAQIAKKTLFYKTNTFKNATSHIDDQYGIAVDEIYFIRDILPEYFKAKYEIKIQKAKRKFVPDELHIGYVKIANLINPK